MTLLIIVGIILIVVIAVLILRAVNGTATWKIEQHGIKITKNKNGVTLQAGIPLHMNLILKKSNSWTRMLGGLSSFQQPKCGDIDFDQMFSITAYRDDVMWVV